MAIPLVNAALFGSTGFLETFTPSLGSQFVRLSNAFNPDSLAMDASGQMTMQSGFTSVTTSNGAYLCPSSADTRLCTAEAYMFALSDTDPFGVYVGVDANNTYCFFYNVSLGRAMIYQIKAGTPTELGFSSFTPVASHGHGWRLRLISEIDGVINMKGEHWDDSAQSVKLISNSLVGASSVTLATDTGTGNVIKGDTFTITGDVTVYTVTGEVALTTGGQSVSFTPTLAVAVDGTGTPVATSCPVWTTLVEVNDPSPISGAGFDPGIVSKKTSSNILWTDLLSRTSDVTSPIIIGSASNQRIVVTSSNGATVDLFFSEGVQPQLSIPTGLSFKAGGVSTPGTMSVIGVRTYRFTYTSAPAAGADLSFSYDDITGDITDNSDNPLEAFTDAKIYNGRAYPGATIVQRGIAVQFNKPHADTWTFAKGCKGLKRQTGLACVSMTPLPAGGRHSIKVDPDMRTSGGNGTPWQDSRMASWNYPSGTPSDDYRAETVLPFPCDEKDISIVCTESLIGQSIDVRVDATDPDGGGTSADRFATYNPSEPDDLICLLTQDMDDHTGVMFVDDISGFPITAGSLTCDVHRKIGTENVIAHAQTYVGGGGFVIERGTEHGTPPTTHTTGDTVSSDWYHPAPPPFSHIKNMIVVTLLANKPSQTSYRPPWCDVGTLNKGDLVFPVAAARAKLSDRSIFPSLTTVHGPPYSALQMARVFARPNFDVKFGTAGNQIVACNWVPSYGRERSQAVGKAGELLCDASQSLADKSVLLDSVLQYGLDCLYICIAHPTIWAITYGGFNNGGSFALGLAAAICEIDEDISGVPIGSECNDYYMGSNDGYSVFRTSGLRHAVDVQQRNFGSIQFENLAFAAWNPSASATGAGYVIQNGLANPDLFIAILLMQRVLRTVQPAFDVIAAMAWRHMISADASVDPVDYAAVGAALALDPTNETVQSMHIMIGSDVHDANYDVEMYNQVETNVYIVATATHIRVYWTFPVDGTLNRAKIVLHGTTATVPAGTQSITGDYVDIALSGTVAAGEIITVDILASSGIQNIDGTPIIAQNGLSVYNSLTPTPPTGTTDNEVDAAACLILEMI